MSLIYLEIVFGGCCYCLLWLLPSAFVSFSLLFLHLRVYSILLGSQIVFENVYNSAEVSPNSSSSDFIPVCFPMVLIGLNLK